MADTAPARSDHRFYSTIAFVVCGVVFTGFGNFYGRRVLVAGEVVPQIIHWHAAIFGSWLILFVSQCWLAARRKMSLHIRLGQLGAILAFAMLVSGIATGIEAARLGHTGIPGVEFADREGFLLLNVSATLVFAVLAGFGLALRSRPETHKRLMLMATVAGLAPPGISRLPLVSGHTPVIAVIVMAFVLAGPIHDWRTRGQVHVAYRLSLPLVLLVLPPVVSALAATPLWRVVANAII